MTTFYRIDIPRCPVGLLWRIFPRIFFPFVVFLKTLRVDVNSYHYPFGRLNGTHFVAEDTIPEDLRKAAAKIIADQELMYFKLTNWLRFPTFDPTVKVIGAAFLSADGLYGLMAMWARSGFSVTLHFSCTSQLYDGSYAVTRPRNNREFYPPPEWDIAPAPKMDLPTVLDGHRQHIAQKHTIPMKPEDVERIIIRLNEQAIDHLVEEGYLIPLTRTEAALARGIEQP